MSNASIAEVKKQIMAVLAPKSLNEIEKAIEDRFGEKPHGNIAFMATLELIQEGKVSKGMLVVEDQNKSLLPTFKKGKVFKLL